MGVLAALKSAGFFFVEVPLAWSYYVYQPAIRVEGTMLSGFSSKRAGERYWIRLDRAEGRPMPPVKVMAYVTRRAEENVRLRPGLYVSLVGRLRRAIRPRNPGGFDERAFLEIRGTDLVFHAREVRITDSTIAPAYRIWAAGESIHRSMHAYFTRRFEKKIAMVLEGLILGFKGPLPPRLGRAIQDAGVMHLLTPSGAKVTVLLAAVLGAGALLTLAPAARLATAALAGGGYIAIVGPEPPYTRAYGMALAAYAAYALGRGAQPFSGLTLSAFVTLIVSPRTLFSAGFGLSYLAMLGLVVALPRWKPPLAWKAPLRVAAQVVAIGLIVQLMLWPAFANFFGRGSVAGLFVNAVWVPASPLLMAAGVLAWASDGLGLGWCETAAVWAAERLAGMFLRTCLGVSAWPGAAIDLPPFGAAGLAAYYCGVMGLLVLPQWRTSLRLWALGAVLGSASAALGGEREILRAVILAPPGGRGMLVSLPDGRRFLVDAGTRPSVRRDLLRSQGLKASDLEAVEVRGKGSPTVFRHGEVRITWSAGEVLVSMGPKVEYCIMRSPSTKRRCPMDRTYFLRYDGAVWITSNGQGITIETQKERHSNGRHFP